MHRTGGVCADKFDNHFFAVAHIGFAVVRAHFVNKFKRVVKPVFFKVKVDKSGACDFASVDVCVFKVDVIEN